MRDVRRSRCGTPVESRGATVELARRQPDGTWKYVIDLPMGGMPR
jgi:hypothetical protein